MYRFTIFRNTEPSVLYFDFTKRTKEVELVAKIFNGDASIHEMKRTQVMTPELRERIPLFGAVGDKAYNIKKFFEEIPDGQKFTVIPEHIEDEIAIHVYLSMLAQENGVTMGEPEMDFISSYFIDHYEAYTFSGEDRRRIGENEKNKRVCRFCGKRMPDAKFKNKAHAISESLGNKGLICWEECDDCNKHFNETIEQDIAHFFQIILLLKGVKGKNGCPELKGEGVSISNNTSSRNTLGRDTLVIKIKDMPDTRNPQEIALYLSQKISFSNCKYIPQNVYKCFCKYVLSLIDSKYLPFFKETIQWINGPLIKRHLPPVWRYNIQMSDMPSLVIMLRKHNHKEIPYCWAILNVASSQYLFIMPFCSLDKYKFVGKTRIAYFIDWLKNIMPKIKLQPIRMDGTDPIEQILDAHFEIPSECVEGRDYSFINLTTEDKKEI